MRKHDFIAALAAIPGNPVIALLAEDIHEASPQASEGTTEGVFADYSIRLLSREEVPDGTLPWIAIGFSVNEKEADA